MWRYWRRRAYQSKRAGPVVQIEWRTRSTWCQLPTCAPDQSAIRDPGATFIFLFLLSSLMKPYTFPPLSVLLQRSPALNRGFKFTPEF